ncbi:MAG TPA: dihydropteroate synthase [Microthrixaceae bacterium]|nr:dihydropteroate synthase [Microthrixaceae bacterium]
MSEPTFLPVAARVMGILNVTPDSFSDGGEHFDTAAALQRAVEMIAEGADVIDVGGESTRPGAEPVDPTDEQRRVIPVIEGIIDLLGREPSRDVRVSIDTRNASTAQEAVRAGATLINDVSSELASTAADLGVGWVAMHMLGDPRTMQTSPSYGDVVDEVRRFLVEKANEATEYGVEEIWIDPGIGFGKTIHHNLELLSRLDEIVSEGFPVLIGTSRKRFLGEMTARSDSRIEFLHPKLSGREGPANIPSPAPSEVSDRLEASLATATWAMLKGVGMVRVHDVDATVQAVAVVSGSIPGR